MCSHCVCALKVPNTKEHCLEHLRSKTAAHCEPQYFTGHTKFSVLIKNDHLIREAKILQIFFCYHLSAHKYKNSVSMNGKPPSAILYYIFINIDSYKIEMEINL